MEGEDQTVVRAAWLYYMEGLTQDRVASRLGITRLRANRLLADARSSGLVNITINSRLSSCLALEEELRRAAGLRDAVVVPSPGDPALLPALLGRAAGEYVSRHLESHKVKGIGVGWGATLREAIRFVKPGRFPHINVRSLMGGLTRGLEINTFETASALAARLGARCSYLAAPLYAGSAKSRDTLVAQDVFRDSFREMAATDVALLSVGDLTERSLLIRYGLPKDVKPASLKRAGAVGDILGRFLDESGTPIDHPINQRVISPALAVLSRIGTVIVASGGENKAPIIAAVLRAKLAAVLITDEETAARALTLCAS
ncbi:MAG TPA: sugar-binding transcriptional regulator [Usitatibacter sp.]|nr:sugar-binding transcriptional regulator [Usitatibacter sp.]